MRENISIFSTKIIQIGLVLIAFLIPIFFLPTTSEFYNFNKTTLLVIGTFFLFLVWGVKMAAESRVRVTRTPLDIALLLFLLVYILATIFSIDKVVSILGWHPTFFGSLPSITAVVLIYFLASSHLDSTYRTAVYTAIVLSASILAAATISHYFGHPVLSASWAQGRNWTAAGDLGKLGFFLALTFPLTLSQALHWKDAVPRYFLYLLAGLQIIAFGLINSLFAYIALIAALLFVLLTSPRVSFKKEDRLAFAILGLLALFILVVINIKGLSDTIFKPLIAGKDTATSLTRPIRLPLAAAWQTSASSVTVRPILGSGPATFGLIFPSFKPISLNAVNTNNIWNIRFDEPNSGILNILATTGALGIIAFLLVILLLVRAMISFSVNSEVVRANPGVLFLQGTLAAFLVGIVFFDLSVISATTFVIIAASFFSTLRDWGSNLASEVDLQLVELKSGVISSVEAIETRSRKPNALAWVFSTAALVLFVAAVLISWQPYQAEFYYQKAILASQANKGKETRDNLVAAIAANPHRDTYHRALLVTDLALARALNQKGNLSQDEQNTLLALVREAIDQGRIATGYEGRGLGSFMIKKVSGTSPANVANWESLATVYANIGGQLRADATVHAINTYSQAIRLDPTNPRLYEALGSVYFNLGDNDNAKKNFELAVSAKPDYASAHYNLAQVLKRKGDNPAGVVNELTATLQLLEDNEQNKQSRERIQKELDEAKKTLEEAQKKQPVQQPPAQIPVATQGATPR